MVHRELYFTATETSTRFYITKGWSPTNPTLLQEISLDYLLITEEPAGIDYISCQSINDNLPMLTASGVDVNDSNLLKIYLNFYYHRNYSHAYYASILAHCSSNVATFVLPQRGTEKDESYAYRFGFNGQEKDDEIAGQGNMMTAEYWEYDSRLGRRWNCDPVVKPWESPYATFSNNPIYYIDPSGDDPTGSGEDDAIYPTLDGKKPEEQSPFYPTPDGRYPGSELNRLDGTTFGAELKEVIIVRDKTTVIPGNNRLPSVKQGYWESIWNDISGSFSRFGQIMDGLLPWRGGYQFEGQGESKPGLFGHGQPSGTIPGEVLDARNAATPALTNGPSKYKPGKPSADDKVIPESVTQAGNVKEQAKAAHGKSEIRTVHSSYLNDFDTTYKVSKEDYDSVSKVVDKIAHKKGKR